MAAVSEWIVREYFEGLGYLVNQPRKHVVPGRHKMAQEEIDLIVHNPRIEEQRVPEGLLWTREDLTGISRAIVAVRGWHTERFYPSTFEQAPEILRFVEEDALNFAQKLLGGQPPAKILCLPRLPASGDLKERAITLLDEKGIDGVLSFETMLVELIGRVDINRNYEKSDLLQTIRILKNYGLLKDSQLDLFEKRPKR
ncbi:MAG: hypothetical protein QGH42_06775 [Kiritimatiellia bacterium]|jgi:hypothetical protein|nr:hypothetical protein [Kiritimatiellia bacterium]MDP6630741.1 hypothetical protein [Kiritimatiellia bacterium]MDP6809396.1 hypothetical protein [Kiritimatiellia bacterium]MDP7023927.1 hypothetical protein [Kiritimatiellia bacterium]